MTVDAVAVQQLMLRYADAIDADDIEAWPDFFTGDGEYTVISRDSLRRGHRIGIMQCFGQGMMRDRVMGLRDANVCNMCCSGWLLTDAGCMVAAARLRATRFQSGTHWWVLAGISSTRPVGSAWTHVRAPR